MTAAQIVALLVGNRYRRGFVLPHYTPHRWWECDVFEATEAGYFREYEVKVSRADFLKDAAKARTVYANEPVPEAERQHPWQRTRLVERRGDGKHELLAAGDPRGPSRFWFVTPTGLLKPEEVPEWAGLIEVDQRKARLVEREVRKAPRRHGEKIEAARYEHAKGVCYWRMHTLAQMRGPDDQPGEWVI